MKTQASTETIQQVSTTVDSKFKQFSIKPDKSLFQLLTSKVYTNTIAAPIREWSTNAVDACIAADKPVKFDVHLPTESEPIFSVRDYGLGLSEDDLLGLFTIVGESTKRNSNKFNGTFGIGRLSVFAYTSSFTVESFYNGKYYSYAIALDDYIPTAIKLAESSTSEPDGLKLSLDVKFADISKFKTYAKEIYSWFEQKPTFNNSLELHDYSKYVQTSDWLAGHSAGVLMGNVLYPLDHTHVNRLRVPFILKLPIGAVAITPGREALSYDTATIKTINTALEKANAELPQAITTYANSSLPFLTKFNILSRLKRYTNIVNNLQVPSILQDVMSYYDFMPTPKDVKIRACYYGHYGIQEHYYGLSDYENLPIILVDMKTNFKKVLKSYLDTQSGLRNFLLLTRAPETTYDAFIKRAETILAYWDRPFIRLSEFAPKVSKAQKTAATTKLYCYNRHTDKFVQISMKTLADKVYYVPSSGAKPVSDKWCSLKLFYRTFLSDIQLIGVPKKYMSLAAKDPKFVPLETAIAEYVKANPIHTVSDNLSQMRRYARQFNSFKLLPFLREWVDKILALPPSTRVAEPTLIAALDDLAIPYTKHDLSELPSKTATVYPLLQRLEYSSYLGHYLDLVYHYETCTLHSS